MDITTNHDAVLATGSDLLKDQDQDLVALAQKVYRTHSLPFSQKLMSDELNWCIITQPIESWAAKVFPALPDGLPVLKLWDAIFQIT